MKKYFILMLLSGSIVAMSPSCKKKDDGGKTYTCTCSATVNKPADQTGVSETDKSSLHGNSCGGSNTSLAKGVGTWTCQ